MFNNPPPGPNAAIEYQVSAIPWVTSSNVGSTTRFDFPYVTSFLTVKNTGSGSINVGFTQAGVETKNHFFKLFPHESFDASFRVTSLFVSASNGPSTVSVMAGLTGIPQRSFPALTASNGFDGVG